MKTFDIVLTKSYKVRIKTDNKILAKEIAQFYTSDITDLSTIEDRANNKFEIENIDCKLNEVFEIKEIDKND